ncbi:WD40 repeat domain-containing protein [Sorangium sp. So ce426]|uniref:WD40 repeat domain-containing protein n=1 Tax=Sorangium sp. So ce426 TaxID=3133312 RepID=UPI003F5BD7B1
MSIAERLKPLDAANPYPGLPAFKESDSRFFFGRKRETLELLQHVRRGTLTVLYGTSGWGKTSLLQAGLFPKLREEKYLPVPVDVDWRHASITPVQQAFAAIANAAQGLDVSPPKPNEALWSYLQQTPIWTQDHWPVMPVLVFDHFEDVFSEGVNRPGVAALLSELSALTEPWTSMSRSDTELSEQLSTKPKARVAIALREDFLAQLDDLQRLIPALSDNRYRLNLMRGTEALEAVLDPGRELGLLDRDVAVEIVRRVARSSRPRTNRAEPVPSAESSSALDHIVVVPALLSLVCRELNERRQKRGLAQMTTELIEHEGDQILADFYTNSLGDLDSRVRVFVEEKLLTSEGRRTSCALNDALLQPGVSREAVEALVQRRLLKLEERFGDEHLELVHDVMAETVHRSRAARRDAEAQRKREDESREEKRRNDEAALAKRRAEAERRRRQLALFGLIALFTLGAGGYITYLKIQENHKNQERAIAAARTEERQKTSADAASQIFEQGRRELLQRNNDDAVRLLGTAYAMAHQEDSSVLPALALTTRWALGALDGQLAVLEGHAGPITAVAYAPPSYRRSLIVTAGKDGVAMLWDGANGEKLGVLDERVVEGDAPELKPRSGTRQPDPKPPESLSILQADGLLQQEPAALASPSPDAGSQRMTMRQKGAVSSVAFDPQEEHHRLVTLSESGVGLLWDISTRKALARFRDSFAGAGSTVDFSPDGRRLLVWTPGGSHYSIFDIVDSSTEGPTISKSCQWPDDGQTERVWQQKAAARGIDGSDASARRKETSLPWLSSVAFDDSGERVFASGRELNQHIGTFIWGCERQDKFTSTRTLSTPDKTSKSEELISAAGFTEDHGWYHTMSETGLARIFQGATLAPGPSLLQGQAATNMMFDRRNSRFLLTHERTRTLWSVGTSTEPARFSQQLPLAWRPLQSWLTGPGDSVITLSANVQLDVWDAETGRHKLSRDFPRTGISTAVSPDGKRFVVGTTSGVGRILSLEGPVTTEESRHDRTLSQGAVLIEERLLDLKRFNVKLIQDLRWVSTPSGTAFAAATESGTVALGTFAADNRRLNYVERLEHAMGVSRVSFDREGNTLLSIGHEGRLALWDVARKEVVRRFETKSEVGLVATGVIAPEGKTIVTGGATGKVCFWSVETWMKRCSDTAQPIVRIELSQDGALAASGGAMGELIVWSVKDGARLRTLAGHHDKINTIDLRNNGVLVTASDDGTARLWSSTNGTLLSSINVSQQAATARLDHAGRRLAVASSDGSVELWDVSTPETPRKLFSLRGHEQSIASIEFSPDDRLFLTAAGKITALWDANTGAGVGVFGDDAAVSSLKATFSPDGRNLGVVTDSGRIRVWQVPSGSSPPAGAHLAQITNGAFSPDGSLFASMDRVGATHVWNLADASLLTTFDAGSSEGAVAPEFSRSGDWLLVPIARQGLALWHRRTRMSSFLDGASQRTIRAVATSESGSTLEIAAVDDRLQVHEWNTGALRVAPSSRSFDLVGKEHSGPIQGIAFHADGEGILTASADGTVIHWNAKTFAQTSAFEVRDPEDQNAPRHAVAGAMMRAGQLLAIGAKGMSLWRAPGKMPFYYSPDRGSLLHTDVTPDGSRVGVIRDGRVLIFDADRPNTAREPLNEPDVYNRSSRILAAPDSSSFLSFNTTGSLTNVVLWDARTGASHRPVLGKSLFTACYNPDGSVTVLAATGTLTRITSKTTRALMTAKELASVQTAHCGETPGSLMVFSGRHAELWDVATTSPRKLREWDVGVPGMLIRGVISSDDGQHVGIFATIGEENQPHIFVCPVSTGDCLALAGIDRGDNVTTLRVSRGGGNVLLLRAGGTAELWPVPSSRPVHVFGYQRPLDIARIQGETWTVTGGSEGTVRVWRSGGVFLEEKRHASAVRVGQLDSTGRYLITGGSDGSAVLWDIKGRNDVALPGHTEEITFVSYRQDLAVDKAAPDAPMFITASKDSTARIWTRYGTTRNEWVLRGHSRDVNMAGFDPNGNFAVTAADDGIARIWDAASGKPLLELAGHAAWLPFAAFSPDGRQLITGGSDGRLLEWDMRLETRSASEIKRIMEKLLPSGKGGFEPPPSRPAQAP